MDDYPYGNVPLGKPPLRQWDLDKNSTWYDRSHAAPSDEFLVRTWLVWSILFYFFSIFNFLVLLSLLLSRKARSKIFNQFLIYLMIPDVFHTGLCAFWCAFLAANGGYMHPTFCKIQSFYNISGVAANSWLNGLLAYEIHKLLTYSRKRLRYFPPTSKSLAGKAVSIYLFSFVLALMGIFDEWSPWLPHKTNVQNGFVCIPVPYNKTSIIFFFTIFYPLLNGIPLAFSIWVTYDIIHNKKLPPRGKKKREVAVYFFRICLVFLAMWLPGLLILFALGSVSPWLVVISGIWAHAQGAVSAGVMMMKPDIYQAFMNLVQCRCFHDEESSKLGSVGELQKASPPPNVEVENAENENTGGGGDEESEEDESREESAMIERLFGNMSIIDTAKRRVDSKIYNGSEHPTSEGSPWDDDAMDEEDLL